MNALFPLLITFGLMWVLLIRPQQRRVRQHQAVVATLVEGDEVVTTGGLIGTIEAINDDVLTVEVAPGVSVRMLRSAVQNRIGGSDAIGPDGLGPDDIGMDDAMDDVEPDEFEPDDLDEEPELPEIETAVVDELPPGASGELPPAQPEAPTIAIADTETTTATTPDDGAPRRTDTGNGV
jgi:preprotein translocase subunit YajC